MYRSALRWYAYRISSRIARWSRLGRPPAISPLAFCFHRRPDALESFGATAVGFSADDQNLIARLVEAYQCVAQRQADIGDSMWKAFFLSRHQNIHRRLVEGNHSKVAEVLRDPASSDIFYGFDNLAASLLRPVDDIYRTYYDYQRFSPGPVLDDLVRLAEAIGAVRLENPEGYTRRAQQRYTVEATIAALEAVFGFTLDFPNPFPGEFGLRSSRGVISYRATHAVYQAWRISQIMATVPNPRVLEIGGGLGRTALYARRFGITDYTIIDIPITSLAQGYFLGRVLGDDTVTLFGEEMPNSSTLIKLLPPSSFLDSNDRYDLIVNVDSLTEMDPTVARAYWTQIDARSDAFLSINHEGNPFTVKQLIDGSSNVDCSSRVPAWMRNGYVEETVCLRPRR